MSNQHSRIQNCIVHILQGFCGFCLYDGENAECLAEKVMDFGHVKACHRKCTEDSQTCGATDRLSKINPDTVWICQIIWIWAGYQQ